MNKIIDRQIDWHLISALVPYIGGMTSQIEAAVIDGALPWEALGALKRGHLTEIRIVVYRVINMMKAPVFDILKRRDEGDI